MSIQSNNAFKEEGKFSVGKYKALLKMNGFEDVEYERMQADALMQNQIRLLKKSLFVFIEKLPNTLRVNFHFIDIILCIKPNIAKLTLLIIQRLHTL
jgi:hypothetical protein